MIFKNLLFSTVYYISGLIIWDRCVNSIPVTVFSQRKLCRPEHGAFLHCPGVPRAICRHPPWLLLPLDHRDGPTGSVSTDPSNCFIQTHSVVFLHQCTNMATGEVMCKVMKRYLMKCSNTHTGNEEWMKCWSSRLSADARSPSRICLQESCAPTHEDATSMSQ